jgi:hypothetical protein
MPGARSRRSGAPLARVEKQFGPVGRVDEGLRGLEVLSEERVAFLAVHLHGDTVGPRVSELRHREARVHEQGSASPGPGLRELLGGHDAEREAGVDGVASNTLGGGHPALGQRAEPRFACEGHALLDRVERAPVEEIGRVHGVPRLPQLVGERPDSLGQPLDVVVQHNFGHLRLLPSNNPKTWNIP